jgi:hypothetical protein
MRPVYLSLREPGDHISFLLRNDKLYGQTCVSARLGRTRGCAPTRKRRQLMTLTSGRADPLLTAYCSLLTEHYACPLL